MARVVAVSSDLLLGSKVEATLSAAGHEVSLSSTHADLPLDVELIVADLDTQDPQALAALGIPILGYYSHVNVETRQAAEAAGIPQAVPRSRLVRELPDLVDRLLADR